jgi:hypothetical protein
MWSRRGYHLWPGLVRRTVLAVRAIEAVQCSQGARSGDPEDRAAAGGAIGVAGPAKRGYPVEGSIGSLDESGIGLFAVAAPRL